jgi:DNA (cytosine-5)-methyltransferase 1
MSGLEFANHFFSEINPHAIKVYEKNFPEAVGLGDIENIDCQKLKAEFGDRWFITGGFPCQDISDGGKRRGIGGSRSGLWFAMLRIIRELRPQAIVAENVSAIAYRGLDRVLLSLADLGYNAEWRILSAKSIGAPHWRKRLWIVAYPLRDGCRTEPASASPQATYLGDDVESDAAPDRSPSWSEWQAVVSAGQIYGQPIIRRMDDGLSPELDRIRGLGNAIVPQVAAKILTRVKPLIYDY